MKTTTAIAMFLLPGAIPALATGPSDPDEVRVLTRNVYVGADIFRVVEAPDLGTVLAEIAAVYGTVVATDFPARAEALADEVLATQPHVIGLQEASLILSQTPGDVLSGNPVPATDVEFDYLQLMLDALEARGLDYRVAASVDNADVELPLFGTVLRDIRLVDRDVILVRHDVAYAGDLSLNYSANAAVELAGAEIVFRRGLNAIIAWIGARPYRIVNTHLETGGAFGAAAQALQAAELVGLFADEFLPTIMLGDFNAGPEDPPEQAYAQLATAGYTDAWSVYTAAPGLTCCHGETLDDAASTLTERIDLIWVRNATTPVVVVNHAEVVGNDPADMTPSGLWPSDHAGVFAALAIPLADTDRDGVDDLADNCALQANADQRDTDGDGYGNACDPDFDQNGIVDFADLGHLRAVFLGVDPDADLDGDGKINLRDLAIFKRYFGKAPGPIAPTAPDAGG